MSQDKIVEFPMHKIKNKILPNYSSAPLSNDQKRILIAALLMSVFLVVTILNTSTFTDSPSPSGRSIASVRLPDAVTSTFEKSVIAKYTSEPMKSAVHIGSRPSRIEGLAFGPLSGSYLISLDAGKIMKINVSEKSAPNYNPQKIKSANAFLEQYRNLLGVDYKTANKTFEKLTHEQKQEEFDLINADQQRVGIATFTFDKLGYFISLQIEKQQSVASR
jgi:hypothetical protein